MAKKGQNAALKAALAKRSAEFNAKNTQQQNRFIFWMSTLLGITIIGGACFLYALHAKSTRQSLTEAGIHAISYSQFAEAKQYLEDADARGEPYASEFMAWMLTSGGQYREAYPYAKRAVEHNCLSAYEVLGDLALLGVGTAKGPAAAMSYFEQGSRLLAQEQIRRNIAGEDAIAFGKSFGRDKNDLGPAGDDVPELTNSILTEMVLRALPLIKTDYEFSDFILRAAAKGVKHLDLQLGDLFFIGNNRMSSNAQKALEYWQVAMDEGQADAFLRMAGAFWHGYACQRDPQTAVDLYMAAAERNNPIALYSLGLITVRNSHEDADIASMAMSLFSRASAHGYGPASTALGVFAFTESDSALASQRAIQWLKIAAQDQKDLSGRVLYDLMLMSGSGVARDFNAGFNDMLLVAQTFEPAQAILALLQKRIPPEIVLRQVMVLSNQILRGEIAYREGDPVATHEIIDEVTGEKLPRPFSFYVSVEQMSPAQKERFGVNNFQSVSDLEHLAIDGQPILDTRLAKIIIQCAPSTGVEKFVENQMMPRPMPPLVPSHYNVDDFVPPVVLLENKPLVDSVTGANNILL